MTGAPRRSAGELLLRALPVGAGAVAGFSGAAATGPGGGRIAVTVVLFAVTTLAVGWTVDRLTDRRRGRPGE
ncbi:MAG: hypothetical protein HOY69_19585 [Streptomyces sp.]|nr:hypothetical protein [Streptomyces sp.]